MCNEQMTLFEDRVGMMVRGGGRMDGMDKGGQAADVGLGMAAFEAAPGTATADPVSSREAEVRHTESGRRGRNLEAVLAGVREFPLTTSRELAHAIGMDRHEVARRLPDLERLGQVRKGAPRRCRVGGTTAVTWVEVRTDW